MSLKELSDIQRILFLQEFTAEIVMHSTEDERLRHLIKVERIKRKLIKEPEQTLEPIGKSIIFNDFRKSESVRKFRHAFDLKKPPQKMPIPAKIKIQNFNLSTRTTEEIMKEMNKMIEDKSVQMIECPGPGKNILVRVRNKMNVTKIVLNETEIKNIINYFSDSARIPIIGGVLKASINSITVSAVISEYAGSRFIINKKSPYNLIANSL